MSLLFGRQTRYSDGLLATGDPVQRDARIRTDHVDAAAALGTVAYFASADLVASLVSTTTLDAFQVKSGVKAQTDLPSWLNDPAGDGQGLEDWLYQVLMSFLMRGNVAGKVLSRDAMGWPTQISLLDFDRIRVRRVEGQLLWTGAGEHIPTASLWTRRAYSVPGAIVGLSPLELHARSLGVHLAAQKFGADFFGADAAPVGVLSSDKPVGQPLAKEAKDRFLAAVRNREIAVLGSGLTYQSLRVLPEESQFLATQKYSAAEVARMFGPGLAEILGYETGKSLTYANIEARALHLQTYTLGKWFIRIEKALTAILPGPRSVKFDLKSLMRTTTLDRYRSHQIGIASHFLLPDEARDAEDLPPLPDGAGQTFPTVQPTPPIVDPPTVLDPSQEGPPDA